jgi:PhnB protein
MAMPALETYLFFDGTCAEAMRFYERTLGGKIEMMMTHGESPMGTECSPANKDRIMHARLVIDGRGLMASDSMEGDPAGMKGFSLSLGYPTNADAQRIFAALSDGAKKVIMPISKTFWAEAFGIVEDRFGTSWMISGPPSKF